jgi:ribonuclease III
LLSSIRVFFSPDKSLFHSLHNILGFYPSNIALYKLALRHSSVAEEIKEGLKNSNERLEFLGDSIIGTVIADYLFKKYPFKDEGFLTQLRSKLVSRETHNQVAVKLGLNQLLQANKGLTKGQSSINGDAYEAMIGAIYLDKGYTFTQHFICNRMLTSYIDVDKLEMTEINFKSKIIEWAQKEKKEFNFEMLLDGSSSDNKQFTIVLTIDNEPFGKAQHYSKKRAEQLAAEEACTLLKLNN